MVKRSMMTYPLKTTNEEVIMAVKLWGVDRLSRLCFDDHSEPNSLSFFNFLFKILLISFFFIHETYPRSSV